MRNKGFTMIEVVIASMLIGMLLLTAFPLFKTGKSLINQKQKDLELSILGDGVFAGIKKEFQNAEIVYFGTEEALSEIYGDSTESTWNLLDINLDRHGLDMEIEAELLEEGWMFLCVQMSEEGNIRYKREETILLPNYEIYKEYWEYAGGIQMILDADEDPRDEGIWYRSGNR